jgi:hypothetical protein
MGLLREMSCVYRGASKTDGASWARRYERPVGFLIVVQERIKFESVQGGKE